MKYILEAYTWDYFYKHQDEMFLAAAGTFIGFVVLILVIAWFAFIKKDFQELNEMEKELSTKIKK